MRSTRSYGEVASHEISDLFIFSHGWNNDKTTALALYERFFGEMRNVMDDATLAKKKPAARIGIAGIVWPSILWPDDEEASMTRWSHAVEQAVQQRSRAVRRLPLRKQRLDK